ncbi:MAG: DNA cytosine methyltransferase, partial [Planctomycetota bacterium]
EWWLMENVARVPDIEIDGYLRQRLDINQGWLGDRSVTRLRHIQFGSRSGVLLNIPRGRCDAAAEGAALASDNRSLADLKRLQGLPDDYELPGMKMPAKKRAIGNGVPLPMGRALAAAVVDAFGLVGTNPERHAVTAPGQVTSHATGASSVTLQKTLDGGVTRPDVCRCGCGRPVPLSKQFASAACRKRAQRRRDRAQGRERVYP